MEHKMYSTSDVAQILKIKPHQLRYAIESGEVADASSSFLGKRVFTQEDVWRLKEYFLGKGRSGK